MTTSELNQQSETVEQLYKRNPKAKFTVGKGKKVYNHFWPTLNSKKGLYSACNLSGNRISLKPTDIVKEATI